LSIGIAITILIAACHTAMSRKPGAIGSPSTRAAYARAITELQAHVAGLPLDRKRLLEELREQYVTTDNFPPELVERLDNGTAAHAHVLACVWKTQEGCDNELSWINEARARGARTGW
jgi:hypothetical protein